MTEKSQELEQAIATLVNKINGGIDATTIMAQEQLPDVIQQLLIWNAITSFITWLIMLVILIVGVKHAVKSFNTKPTKEDYDKARRGSDMFNLFYDVEGDVHPLCLCYLFLIIPFICVFGEIDWLQILIVPKVYLLEYAKTFVM